MSGSGVGLMLCGVMVFGVLTSEVGARVISVGTLDNSSDEFLQGGFTGQPINLDTQTSSNFPKELNNSWYTNQAFFFTLSGSDVTNPLSATLIPAWSLSNNAMRVALDVYVGTNWQEVEQVDIGRDLPEAIVVPVSRLVTGTNRFRVRSADPRPPGAAALTWDQIVLSRVGLTKIILGRNDASSGEFKQSGFTGQEFDLDNGSSTNFPKELNNTWYTNQPFDFVLAPAAARKDLAITLNANWCLSNAPMTVAVEQYSWTNWLEAGRVSVTAQVPGVVLVASSNLSSGFNYFRLRSVEASPYPRAVTWDQIIIENKSNSSCLVLGRRDYSGAEFKPSGFTGAPADVDHESVTNFPRELNDSWYTNQQFYFILNRTASTKQMAVTLDPAWIDNTNGTLTVALDLKENGTWRELGRVDVNDAITGLIMLDAADMPEGLVHMRLRTVQGNGGAHAVVWDQIIIETKEAEARVVLGRRNGSSLDFQQEGFNGDAVDADHQTSMDFPEELNDSWFTNQSFYFIMSQAAAQQDLTLALYPAWIDNTNGSLTVAVDIFGASGWSTVAETNISPAVPAVIVISTSNLVEGFNDFRLRTVRGNGGAHSMAWDQIALRSRSLDGTTVRVIGDADWSDLDFMQSGYTADFVDLDNAFASDIGKELNMTWYTNLNLFMWLDSAQVTKDLVFTLDPAWGSATGSLNVALDVWSGTAWKEVSVVELNGKFGATVAIAADDLTTGYNNFRIRSVSSNWTTTAITWDQIVVQSRDIALAHNNSYPTPCAEEDNLNVPFRRKGIRNFRIIATHPTYYPQDLNSSASDFTGCDWPIENSVMVRVVSSTGDTSYLYWDSIRVENHAPPPAKVEKLVGTNDNSCAEFHQVETNYFHWTDIDWSGATKFPKEINTNWWQFENFVFWLNEDQLANDVDITFRTSYAAGTGTIRIAVDVLGRKNNSDWVNLGTNDFSGIDEHTFTIPFGLLKMGIPKPPGGGNVNTPIFKEKNDANVYGQYAVEVATLGDFWLGTNSTMNVHLHVPDEWATTSQLFQADAMGVQYVCVYRNEPLPSGSGPQFIGLYQDGYCRLLPQPNSNTPPQLSMGPSTIIGPVPEAFRPYTQISNVEIYLSGPAPTTRSFGGVRFDITYVDGTFSRWDVSLNDQRVMLDVRDATYDTENYPFVTLRSMWVLDGDSDTDRLVTKDLFRPILKWKDELGDRWFFTRKVPSYHQTTNPDITVEMLDPTTIFLVRQAEYPLSTGVTCHVHANDTAQGQKCLYLPEPNGEASWKFTTTTTRDNAYLQVLYADGRGGNIVTVYLDGVTSGQFTTYTTWDWQTFQYSDRVRIGTVSAGTHTIRMATGLNPDGYSDGLKVDLFELLTIPPLLNLPEQIFRTVQAESVGVGKDYQIGSSTGAVGGLNVMIPATGGEVAYYVTITQAVPECYMRLRYNEDSTNWNTVNTYLDGNKKGKFPTRFTGGPNSYEAPWPVWLGALCVGTHEIRVQVEPGITGVNLDQFTLHYVNPDTTMPIAESGKITVDQPSKNRWRTVNLTNLFTTPVVVMQPASCTDTNPAHIRLGRVQRDRFSFQIEEWNYEDAVHGTETVSYVVMEAGQHRLADGTKIEAGLDSSVNSAWKSVSLLSSFTSTPVILTQAQTTNESDSVVTRQMIGTYGSTTNTVPAVSTNAVRLGLGYTGLCFNGLLDEVMIRGAALAEEEITGNYSQTTLAAYWKCDEAVWNGTSNEVLDASTNLNRGRSYNGAVTTTDAKLGRAGWFDGTNDYVEIPNKASLQITTNLTISFWIKGRNLGAARFNPLDKDYGGEFSLTIETNRGLSYYHGTARTSGKYWGWTALPAGSLTNNAWQHITIVRDTGTRQMRSYINGVQKSTTTYVIDTNKNPKATTSVLRMAKGYTGSCLGGVLDEVKISRAARTAAEVAQEYGRGNLAAYWKCDETSWGGVSNDVADSS
ncbi:MAG: hypothetical protein BWK77_05270, partial [Verrucomicrobia bacterium A1]